MFLEPEEIEPMPVYDPASVGAGAWSGRTMVTPPPFTDVDDEWCADEAPHPHRTDRDAVTTMTRLDGVRPFPGALRKAG